MITIERHGVEADLAETVRAGLTGEPKELPPKLFYDARGSELFDRITAQPEYYPARAERSILNRYSPEIVSESGAEELVELGSGVASKTRALLYAMAGAGTLDRYVPFDIDDSVVEACAEELHRILPGMDVHGVVGDFGRDLEHLPRGEHRLIAFLGGTVGNLYPAERTSFLARVREQMGSSDYLLLGMDLLKDQEVLEAAYNDAAGATAEFNLNLSARDQRAAGRRLRPRRLRARGLLRPRRVVDRDAAALAARPAGERGGHRGLVHARRGDAHGDLVQVPPGRHRVGPGRCRSAAAAALHRRRGSVRPRAGRRSRVT